MNLDALAQTPSTQYLLNTYYSYFKYFGPGADDTALTSGTPANARFSVNHTTPLTLYNFAASWSRSDIATAQLAESGVATGRGTLNTYSLNGGLVHDLGRLDTVSWTAAASTASSTSSDFTPYFDMTSTIAWNHTLTQTTTLVNSVNFDWFSQDNDANTQRLLWKFLTGFDSRLTRRLAVNGHFGLIFVNAYQDGPQTTVAPVFPVFPVFGIVPFQPTVGAANGYQWDVGLTYNLLKTTTASLTAANVVFPTITGELQRTKTLGLSVTHQINSVSNLSFFTHFAQTTSGAAAFSSGSDSKSEFASAGLNYSYSLTRDWRTALSYTYRQRNDNSGFVNANTVMFSLNYDFNLFGNPAPINRAAQQRARERAQSTVGYVFPTFH